MWTPVAICSSDITLHPKTEPYGEIGGSCRGKPVVNGDSARDSGPVPNQIVGMSILALDDI